MSTILIVDDDSACRAVLRTVLRSAGHTPLDAGSAKEGLCIALSALPDLIVTDVLMPETDGFELVRQIRLSPGIANTRVVLWTGVYGQDGGTAALAETWGVSCVLSKTTDLKALLRSIETALGEQEKPVRKDANVSFDRDRAGVLADKIFEQVTELEAARQYLNETQQQYRMLFEGNPFPLWILEEDSLAFLEVNDAAIRQYGYSRDEFLQMTLPDIALDFVPGTFSAEYGYPRSLTRMPVMRHTLRDGRVIDVEVFRVATQFNSRKASLALVTDVTERNTSEQRLRESERQLHDLATRLRSAQEEERKRIARHLHDELGQSLTALKMSTQWVAARMSCVEPELAERLQTSVKLADEMIRTVRRLATELRPGMLDLGIAAAIEWQAGEFQANTDTECVVHLPATEEPLDENCATEVFRICQEALTNVTRHAGATRVDITLRRDRTGLTLEVHDNGRGITPGEVSGVTALGVLGMRERAALIGGTLTIDGSPHAGTTVRVWVPFDAPRGNSHAVGR